MKVNQQKYSLKHMRFLGAFIFAAIAMGLLINGYAAATLVVDNSLPVPQNIRAFGDDRTITVTWDPVNDSRVVGYYLTYRLAGSSDELKVRQTEARKDNNGERVTAIQLQPLVNGQNYEINVHSAAGAYEEYPGGPLVWGGNEVNNRFAVGNGNISSPASLEATPSGARVAEQRQNLTGFFDDFNIPAGPFDELKWNQAANACVEAGTAAAFINAQFHSHNMVRTTDFCDRAGMASRPRATFNTTGASASNPAQIEFDIDGAHHGRDAWYLDIIPLSARNNRLPMDITSHNDLGDGDIENPGNIVRLNANYERLTITYYGQDNVPVRLDLDVEQSACTPYSGETDMIRYGSCNMTQKTAGISPLPQIDIDPSPIANVRRHWTVRLVDTTLRVYIDGTHIATATLPTSFVNEREYTLHSTIFSYNTGKDSQYQIIPVTPYVQLLHWDNFGFTGPASDEVIHNYLEGQETGDKPIYSIGTAETRIQTGNRRTIIPIPDQIGTLKDDTARLYFTVQPLGFHNIEWDASWHIIVNGTRYNVPDPRTTSPQPFNSPVAATNKALPYALEIPRSDIQQGDNIIDFNFGTEVINIHIELPYDADDPNIPEYSQPIEIFGSVFRDIVQPAITNCDYYRSIEQDLNLPYESGKENLEIGTCAFLGTNATQVDNNPGGTDSEVCEDTSATNTGRELPCQYDDPDLPPTSDTQSPSIVITSPALNTQVTSNTPVEISASDNVGVTQVDYFVNGTLVRSDTAAPFTYTFSTNGLAPGDFQLTARAYDAADNSALSSPITVTIPQSPEPDLRPGDVNGDNRITIADFSILSANFGRTGVTRAQGDLNADGRITIADFSILSANFGR